MCCAGIKRSVRKRVDKTKRIRQRFGFLRRREKKEKLKERKGWVWEMVTGTKVSVWVRNLCSVDISFCL